MNNRGFTPQAYDAWINARRAARLCRQNGDYVGELVAKLTYRNISYKCFGYSKPRY